MGIRSLNLSLRHRRREIPCSQWTAFLDEVNRRCAGWMGDFVVLRTDGSPQTEIYGLPFTLASVNGGIAIVLSWGGESAFRHEVPSPARLLLEDAHSDCVRLRIVADDGVMAVLDVRPAPGQATALGRRRPRLHFEHGPPSMSLIPVLAAVLAAAAAAYFVVSVSARRERPQ